MAKKREIVKASDRSVEPVKVEVVKEEDGTVRCDVKPPSSLAMTRSTGCRNQSAGFGLLETALHAFTCDAADYAALEKLGNRLMNLMAELQPQDALEAMLISQMVVVHEQAMNCIRMASSHKSSNADMHFSLQNQGIKLMRLHSMQLEALDRHRRKGNQRMTIEHIHVSGDGKAIIGNLAKGEG